MTIEVRELTPPGAGAVSVLRIRGAHALRAVRELAPHLRADVAAPQVVRLRLDGEELDEAIACALAPHEIELHVHGSVPLVKRVVEHLRRACEDTTATSDCSARDGRAPTIEERAEERLARAESDSAARILLDQCGGALRAALHELSSASDSERASALRDMLERGRVARFALEPIDVVIAGPVNAGKSTLFNVLLGEERTIVGAEEGTTRDAVSERATLGAYPVRLTDTAGERDLASSSSVARVERAGQEHARRARAGADVVLWLVRADGAANGSTLDAPLDSSRLASPDTPSAAHHHAVLDAGCGAPLSDRGRLVILHTQIDRVPENDRALFRGAISALREPERARERVCESVRSAFELPAEPWSAGSAVPFDAELMNGLRALPVSASADAWTRAVAALIGEL